MSIKVPPQKFNIVDDLHDDHAMEHLSSLLSLTPNALESSPATSQEASSDSVGSCVVCTDLMGTTRGLIQEQVTYHMNAKFVQTFTLRSLSFQ